MKPEQMRWANLKVGIVVLIGLIVFIFIVSIVGTEQNIFISTYALKIFVINVHGLVEGGMVTLGGLKIGYVSHMAFMTRDGVNGVDITFDILTRYRQSITTSTSAQIKTIGLLGDKYIDLTIGSRGEQELPEYSYVPLVESFDIETAGPQFKSSLEDFTALMASTRRIASSMEKGEGAVGRLLRHPNVANDMEKFLRSLNGVMAAILNKRGAIGTVVYDDSLSRDLREVTSNMKSVTDRLRQGKGTMGQLIMDDKLYATLSSFAARADTLAGKAASDSSSVSKLIGDGDFYERLLALMRDLNLLLVDLKEHPERYVRVSVF